MLRILSGLMSCLRHSLLAVKSGIYFSGFKEFVNKNFICIVITLQPLAGLKGVFSWMLGKAGQ